MQGIIFKGYDNFLNKNNFNPDPDQLFLVAELDILAKNLNSYYEKKKFFSYKFINKMFYKLFPVPKGLYIHGGVGCGKTMIMKLFYGCIKHKRSGFMHFYDFMNMLHKSLHEIRSKEYILDPIKVLADNISEKYDLICLDELFIIDVSDVMLLYRVFLKLYEKNVILIITSNRSIEDLYNQDFGKEHFKKLVDLLLAKMQVIKMSASVDYRMMKLKGLEKTYYIGDEKNINNLIARLEIVHFEPKELKIFGRTLKLNSTYQSMLFTDFEELCNNNLSQNDYMEICKHFKVIFMKNIPRMTKAMFNQVTRFINFIDNVYSNNIILICNAAASPEELYVSSGKMSFEFQRTVSRLNEMQSQEYIKANKFAEMLNIRCG